MNIFLVILWGITGIMNLCGKQISKLSYACVWGILMLYMIMNVIGA